MKTIKPGQGIVFAKPSEKETKTASGILLTEASAENPKTAEVINVGPGVTQYSPHDSIVYKEYSTSEIKLNGEEYFLIREQDVLGIVLDVE